MTVRKIRAKLVLQLRAEGLSGRAIAASQGMSRKSVAAVLEAADATETSWDDVAELTDEQVYARLFPGRGEQESVFAQPDWEQVLREMARVGVTLKLLHGEYADCCATSGAPAMGYDRWCKTYQRHEWLLDHPDDAMRSMLLELLERRHDTGSTVFCTQYAKKDWRQRLGSRVHADAIMDRIVHNTLWIDTGTHNMREHAAATQ